MLATAPMSPRARWVLGGLVAVLVVVSVLVAAGAFTRFDQLSLDHFMPWLVPGSGAPKGHSGFYLPFRYHTSNWLKLLDVVTYPCSLLVSGLVVAAAAAILWRPLGPIAALAPTGAWVAGNAIEVLLKETVVRPAVYGVAGGVRTHVVTFDDSFASGHMLRAIIVAYTLTLLWSGASPWVWVWAALVGPALVLEAAHTPSDVIGGALIGLLLLVPVHAVVEQARRERAAV